MSEKVPDTGQQRATAQVRKGGEGADGNGDSPKRRQILEGASRLFLDKGFDATSVGDIARAAGVSKGTIYVYFEDKERLFVAFFTEAKYRQAEQVFDLDPGDRDVAAVLTRLGRDFLGFMVKEPSIVAAARTIIAIAARMPELGQEFYQAGPAVGIARLAEYLDAQVANGTLRIEDTSHAAAQFIDLCHSGILKPLLFGMPVDTSPGHFAAIVDSAVAVFLSAYAAPSTPKASRR